MFIILYCALCIYFDANTITIKLAQYDVQHVILITHAGCIVDSVGRSFCLVCLFVCLTVCLCVRALKGKRLELSTPNVVLIHSIVVARYAPRGQISKVKVTRLRKPPRSHGC